MKVGIHAGHGNKDSGAVGISNLLEKNLNLYVAQQTSEILRQNGIEVILSRNDDTVGGTEFERNTASQWNGKVDLALSIHFNAYSDNSANGFEVGRNNNYAISESLDLCKMIEKSVVETIGIKSRGIKQFQFTMNAQKFPCAYCEGCFITSTIDLPYFKDNQALKKYATAYAKAVIAYRDKYFPTTITTPIKTKMYRVITGSFADRTNAEKRITELKAKGFDSFLEIKEV